MSTRYIAFVVTGALQQKAVIFTLKFVYAALLQHIPLSVLHFKPVWSGRDLCPHYCRTVREKGHFKMYLKCIQCSHLGIIDR